MSHFFLVPPDHSRAYRILCDRPTASTRSWAAELGWTQTRLRTFLKNLAAYGLGSCHSLARAGSVFVAGSAEKVSHSEPLRDAPRYSELPDLVKSSGLTATRCGVPPVEKSKAPVEPMPGAEKLIESLNTVMMRRFPNTYLPVSSDNHGSHRAARRLLAAAKIPLDDAVELVRTRAELYTPDKTGGDLPRSLGHPWFSTLLIVEWKRTLIDRRQLRLPLMQIESGTAVDEGMPAAIADLKRRLSGTG